jgi:hypothetical protein
LPWLVVRNERRELVSTTINAVFSESARSARRNPEPITRESLQVSDLGGSENIAINKYYCLLSLGMYGGEL